MNVKALRASLIIIGVAAMTATIVLVARRWPSRAMQEASTASATQQTAQQLWTCGMHPQVVQDKPGTCPICHMKLTPMRSESSGGEQPATSPTAKGERKILYYWDPMLGPSSISNKPGKSAMGMDMVPVYSDQQSAGATVRIDPTIIQNMGVRTEAVTRGPLEKIVRTVGVLKVPEPGLHDISLKVNGWIDKLYADTDGMLVRKDQPLFELYSPEVQVAEEELIGAAKSLKSLDAHVSEPVRRDAQSMVDSAKRKLRLWDIAEADIDAIASADKPPRTVIFRSPATGHVIDKMIVQGSAVQMGMKLLRIEDHSKLWLDAEVYEEQLPWISMDQTVEASVQGVPDKVFTGKVLFVYPQVDHMTRTETVRTMIDNPEHELRPGMYATARIITRPVSDAILVPREAVIDTGRRQIAFVAQAGGKFEPRKVRMGLRGEDRVQIMEGLLPGETVVTSGQFLMDVESRTAEAIEKLRSGAGPATAAQQKTLTLAHCPMKTADWLQAGDEIANPYFGQQMSGCGEVTKHLSMPPEESVLNKVASAYLAVQKDLNADKLSAPDDEALAKAASDLAGDQYTAIRQSTGKLAEAKDLAAARAAFQSVSDELIRLLDHP